MRLQDFLKAPVTAVAFEMNGGGGGGGSNTIEIERQAESVSISSGNGSAAMLPAASQSQAGVLGTADKAKLDAMSGATARIQTRARIETTHVAPSLLALQTDGFAETGDGGAALYVRRAEEPLHEGKVRSADGDWWELAPDGPVRASQFGAVEDADVTAAVQAAINFVAYGNTSDGSRRAKPLEVLIDVGRGTISDTIHLGYGLDFKTVIVRGLGQAYSLASQHMGTTLSFTATDRPAFVISGGRDTAITDLTVIGAAESALLSTGVSGIEPTLEETWDAALTEAGITRGRYTPYAGIAIDAYASAEPAVSYPPVACPDYISGGSFSTYDVDKKRTSSPRIERVSIRGFEVGVAQTPADQSSNGDFAVLRNVRFISLKYAYSAGNSQSRIPAFYSCQFASIWTVLANNIHGKQSGTTNASFFACGFGAFIGRLFSLGSLSYGGGLTFNGCDVESLHRFGDIAGGATQATPIIFRNCSINFRHSDTNGHPANVLWGGSTSNRVIFDGGEVRWYSVGSFVAIGIGVINGMMFNFDATGAGTSRDKPYGQIASNALAGGLAVDPYYQTPEIECVFQGYDLDSNTSAGTLQLDTTTRATTRRFSVPLWSPVVQRGAANGGKQLREALRRPIMMDKRNRGSYPVPPSVSGRTITFSAGSLATNEQNAVQQGYRNGGVIFDMATGTVAFIRSVDRQTGVVEAEMQNNFISDGAGGYTLFDPSFDPANGFWEVFGTAVYLAPQPISGTTSTASAAISVAAMQDNPESDYGLGVGDWLFEDMWPTERTFSSSMRARIASIAAGGPPAGGTITMSGVANETHTKALSFDWWVRGEPDNEPER